MMTHGSLFSGQGGFDLAASWMGWENVFQVENNKKCQKVLKCKFPNSKRYGDIKGFDATKYRGAIDVLSGGFPCQTFSLAGKGEMDVSLWKEMFRVIQESCPRIVVAENVYGLFARKEGLALEMVCSDLEAENYTVLPPLIIPACSVGAPYRRDRIWIIAYANGDGFERWRLNESRRQASQGACQQKKWEWVRAKSTRTSTAGRITDTNSERLPVRIFRTGFTCNEKAYAIDQRRTIDGTHPKSDWSQFPSVSPLSARNDGVSVELDRYTDREFKRHRKESIESGGNAIVPQIAFEIFKAIEATLI